MTQRFTAHYSQQGKWYVGWIEEIPGVNTQGRTLKEARENLQEALGLIVEVNRALMKRERAKSKIIRETVTVDRQ